MGKPKKILIYRLSGHLTPNSLKTNTHKNYWIKLIVKNKLRPEIILIDEVIDTEWKFWEQWYISYFKSIGCNLTNETPGGDGWEVGQRHKPETIEKLRQLGYKRKHTEEERNKISKSNMGKVMSIESRAKMSLAKKGVPKSQEFKDKVSNTLKNRIFTDEHRQKLSISAKNRKTVKSGE